MTTPDPIGSRAPEGTGPQPDGERRSARLRRAARRIETYVLAAPGTFLWLLILGINTFALVNMSPRVKRYFLITHSTNLVELSHHPVKVLISSAFWTATPSFALWFLLFNLFHVPVERWLGTPRWLAVAAIAHVVATLVSEGTVDFLISTGRLPQKTSHTIDIGVSYALSGSVGVLAWIFSRPQRWYYLGVTSGFFLALLIGYRDFTNLGHFTAFLIGLACYPLTRGVPGGGRTLRFRSRAGT